ncbi:MAG: helix-turn-helix domain-containing protein [Candidatus Liptonbacteria bacterium]|nr:helix-turn-helix domain-containing protein [Candidatus Liptonbacteria bacterium]
MMDGNIHDLHFEEYLTQIIKDRGLAPRKLSELSGISIKHIEGLACGNFAKLPSAPYVRGYLLRLGEILRFDPEPWWIKLKASGFLKDSGPRDLPPKNRFLRRNLSRIVWTAGAALVLVTYITVQFGHISGAPKISMTFPQESQVRTDQGTINLAGRLTNGTELSVNGEPVKLEADGSWTKSMLLSPGMNTAMITAKKFLGRETNIVKEIIYEPTSTVPSDP